MSIDLPPGLTSRPLVPGDLDAVFVVFSEAELADTGKPGIEVEDIEGDWARTNFDLSSQSVGVFEGERLVGTAEVADGRRADAAVLPSHQGRGIGSWLARWSEEQAKRDGGTLVGQSRFGGSPGETLLRGRGYETLWTSWVLELSPEKEVTEQPLPQGYSIRGLVPGQDDHIAYQVVEDAFNEWPNRNPQTFDDWSVRLLRRRGFEPWQMRLAIDHSNEVVGVAALLIDSAGQAYIDQLAVRGDQRGLGLARALMADAFRLGREKGAVRFGLSTDSRTGALGLYEKVGMHVTQTWYHLAKQI